MTIAFGTATSRPIVRSLTTGAEQAWAGVQLYDPVRNRPLTRITDCVIDTGSQYTILPAAVFVGIGIPAGPTISIRTISGAIARFGSHQVDLLIERLYHVGTTVLSTAARGFTPVLGLADAKDAFDFGFDFSQWYFS
jgi:predicted aspartyl protease